MANIQNIYEKLLPKGKFVIYTDQPEFNLLRLKQTHSNMVLDESLCNGKEADGMVGTSSTPMAILTADCLPIVVLGKHGHAFIHAGWRGLHKNILKSQFISNLSPYYAFIGPHICQEHYEVQPDFLAHFPQHFFKRDEAGKIYFSLAEAATAQLQHFFPSIMIEIAELCTFEENRLNSFRRNKTEKRNWNIYIP